MAVQRFTYTCGKTWTAVEKRLTANAKRIIFLPSLVELKKKIYIYRYVSHDPHTFSNTRYTSFGSLLYSIPEIRLWIVAASNNPRIPACSRVLRDTDPTNGAETCDRTFDLYSAEVQLRFRTGGPSLTRESCLAKSLEGSSIYFAVSNSYSLRQHILVFLFLSPSPSLLSREIEIAMLLTANRSLTLSTVNPRT